MDHYVEPEKALAAPIVDITAPDFQAQGVSLSMLRLDAIDPVISGNKWFKLRFHLEAARAQGARSVLSFGGAFSNHLHALAAATQDSALQSIAIVRGERPLDASALSPTLRDCENMGMRLHFVSRSEYRRREEQSYQQGLLQQFPGSYLVPEGGGGEQGVRGAATIAECFDANDYDVVATACGTGTTLAGLARALAPYRHIDVLGVSALKDQGSIALAVSELLAGQEAASWRIDERFHGGGFARINAELLSAMQQFQHRWQITLEPVYTGKLILALQQMLMNKEFAPGCRILALHSGGLQGLRGMHAAMSKLGWREPLAAEPS